MNEYFSDVFVKENLSNIPNLRKKNSNCVLDELNITENIVLKKLLNSNIAKSMGPEDLHPHLVKELANEITVPLRINFKKSLAPCSVPDDWNNSQYHDNF